MKKLTALFLAVFMAVSLSVNLYAADFDVSDYKNPFTDTAYTEDSFYGNGTIIIILSHEASIEWREYTKEDFPELELDSVDTKDPASTDKEFILGNPEYRNFVHITLKDKSNKAVIEAIELLYNRNDDDYMSENPKKDIHLALPMYKSYYTSPDIKDNWDEGKPISAFGDANGDDRINISDASLILKHIAKWDGLEINIKYSDANKDGKINISDVSYILKKIAGWDMPEIPTSEFLQKLVDDYTKYMEENYKYDPEKDGELYVMRYYGSYNNSCAVMFGGLIYSQALWTDTVAGSDIHYRNGNMIFVRHNGDFYSVREAFEAGYLTTEQVAKIAEINNKGKYIEYSIGF